MRKPATAQILVENGKTTLLTGLYATPFHGTGPGWPQRSSRKGISKRLLIRLGDGADFGQGQKRMWRMTPNLRICLISANWSRTRAWEKMTNA